MLAALEAEGITVQDGQQVMLDAREVKSIDEIMLLNTACALVDGAYQLIAERLKPGIRENQLVAEVTKYLFDQGSEHVDNINAVSGERCSPHPHVFSDRLIRPGDQAFFDIIQTFMGYKTCYYRTFMVGKANDAQRDAYKQAREWIDASIELMRPGVTTDQVAEVWPKAEDFGFANEMECFGLQFGHGVGLFLHERPIISRLNSLEHPVELKEGMVIALETYCPAKDGISAARIEEEVVVTADGPMVITPFPVRRAVRRQCLLEAGHDATSPDARSADGRRRWASAGWAPRWRERWLPPGSTRALEPDRGAGRSPRRRAGRRDRWWRDPGDAAAGADVVLTMLADEAAVDAVYGGPTGWSRARGPASSLVDCSTVPPGRSLRAHAAGGRARRRWPARRARCRAAWPSPTSGKLTLMVGGEAADLERARPVLDALGSTHLPPWCAGHRRGHEARREHRHLRAQPGDRGGAGARGGGRDRAGGGLRRARGQRRRRPVRRLQAGGVPGPGRDAGRVRAGARGQGPRLIRELADALGVSLPQARTDLEVIDAAVAAGRRSPTSPRSPSHLGERGTRRRARPTDDRAGRDRPAGPTGPRP